MLPNSYPEPPIKNGDKTVAPPNKGVKVLYELPPRDTNNKENTIWHPVSKQAKVLYEPAPGSPTIKTTAYAVVFFNRLFQLLDGTQRDKKGINTLIECPIYREPPGFHTRRSLKNAM